MITKKMFDVLKKSPYDHSGEYGGTQPPSESTLKKLAKAKKGQPLLIDLCALPNEEILDKKTTEIIELTGIIYNSIIQSYLGGKITYSPYEFQAGVNWFVSEGIKALPQPTLNKFYEYTPEDFEGCVPTEIIDAIYQRQYGKDIGRHASEAPQNLSIPKNLEHKIDILKKISQHSKVSTYGKITHNYSKNDTIKKAKGPFRTPKNSKNKKITNKETIRKSF